MTDSLPQEVIDHYFEGLLKSQLVDGKSYQVPWYQGVAVELINSVIFEAAGLRCRRLPEDQFEDGIPALCQTIKDKTGKLCDIRLTVNDLLAQMVYEGGVEVRPTTAARSRSTAEGVAWLQMYVDMVAAGTVDNSR